MDPAEGRHLPLLNLSKVRSRMDDVQRFLTDSLKTNTVIPDAQMEIVTKEITAAINDAIVNGAALLSCSGFSNPPSTSLTLQKPTESDPKAINSNNEIEVGFPKTEALDEEIGDDLDVVELDAVELLAEHLHFCDFCGKGFKRDANLRMHMRAHGNKFKTLEALSKPEKSVVDSDSTGVRRTRFSCPFAGCSRNKLHKKFRPLKSVICVKNHFKRSHCPKMYSCNRCHKKNFSVLADLKSHLKHCGETKWKCSCGTSFSRKDKLFGHIALFEGHMPAMPAAEEQEVVVEAEDDGKAQGVPPPPVVENAEGVKGMGWVDDDMFFDGLDGLGSVDDDFCLQDILGAGSMDWNL
ncbi:hypothetical protein L1987_28213 [Smallanthus sonchifolius]|uniref:Uncharacterized protein n=1 Tax=Smallanthus sonchifolius TaxID=185202 RepID=A0ACB9IDA6_9ASTR|nr:hypothetical protein L1987_28213 [Smallanthus sonchifolius]